MVARKSSLFDRIIENTIKTPLGKVCFIDYRKEGKDILFEGYKGPILLGAAALGLGTLSIADHNKIKSTADKLGIELAETEYGSHEAAGLIYPIYEYKYDMKGPMNIDSLCKYLKDNTNFDEITYDDEGDHYVINYIDNYTIHQKVGNASVSKHRTSEGNLNLPKNYFDFSFVLDESYNKSQLFDRVLNESSLKENECSLEQLLSKAYVSDYKMGSKNSAIVRVRTSPALLTADSMAARFEEDIPDGYELEVEYLGEDPILGRNLDIYEVQLLKN